MSGRKRLNDVFGSRQVHRPSPMRNNLPTFSDGWGEPAPTPPRREQPADLLGGGCEPHGLAHDQPPPLDQPGHEPRPQDPPVQDQPGHEPRPQDPPQAHEPPRAEHSDGGLDEDSDEDFWNADSEPVPTPQDQEDQVACVYADKGCDAVGSRLFIDDHIPACPFACEQCPAREFGCPEEGPPAAMRVHRKECVLNKLRPFMVKTKVQMEELKTRHHQLQRHVRELRQVGCVTRSRAQRIRNVHRQGAGLLELLPSDVEIVFRVMHPHQGPWFHPMSVNATFRALLDTLPADTVLSCDGPVDVGGLEIKPHNTPQELGLLPSLSPDNPMFDATLYVHLPQRSDVAQ